LTQSLIILAGSGARQIGEAKMDDPAGKFEQVFIDQMSPERYAYLVLFEASEPFRKPDCGMPATLPSQQVSRIEMALNYVRQPDINPGYISAVYHFMQKDGDAVDRKILPDFSFIDGKLTLNEQRYLKQPGAVGPSVCPGSLPAMDIHQ
jgi:hypothetical protein